MIERTFGIFKGRWHCLKTGLRYNAEKAVRIIVACAVLHNLIYQLGDSCLETDSVDIEHYPVDQETLEELDEDETPDPKRRRKTELEEGRLYRDRLTKTFFSKN